MMLCAEIQVVSASKEVPSESDIEEWIRTTLTENGQSRAQITLRVVDEAEIADLNSRYRKNPLPTDVLAFSHPLPHGVDMGLVGDVVVCADVINHQADQNAINRQAHWARIITHGVLHLLGYDHDQPQLAQEMESAERTVLSRLGLSHPELHEHAP